jgi:hypothetical protein
MSIAILLKIFSDCCLIFAILCAGPVSLAVPALIPALICGIAAALATFCEDKGWSALCKLCAALPLCCVLLGGSIGNRILFLIPAAYTSFIILRGELALEYSDYRYFFTRSLALLGGAYVVAGIWNYLIQITASSIPSLDAAAILRYSMVHLLCGVVLQRQLRLGVGYRAEGGRRQMATLLGTTGVIVVGFLTAEPLLRQGFSGAIRFLISLILIPLMFLVELISNWIIKRNNNDKDQKAHEAFMEHLQNIGFAPGGEAQPEPPPPAGETINLDQLWIVLAAIMLLFAAALLLYSFRKRKPTVNQKNHGSRVVTPPKKQRTSALSNRSRVRQLYRDFLRTEQNLGMQIKTSHTSGDILEQIHKDTDPGSAAQLREVYLSARYDDRQNISRSQVERAKQALRGTRKTS